MSGSIPVEVFSLEVGPFASNCHFIQPAGSRDILLVDPGGDAEAILRILQKHQWRVALYLLTHGHMDHVSALAEVREHQPAPVAMHPTDAAWAFGPANTMPPFFPDPPRATPIDRALAEGQRWTDLGLSYDVLETPGHSRGSVSFHFPDHGLLFPGDVLFQDSVGRSDLPGGDPRVLTRSLQRLLTLPDATHVFPGHGPATTLERERKHNPYLKTLTALQ